MNLMEVTLEHKLKNSISKLEDKMMCLQTTMQK